MHGWSIHPTDGDPGNQCPPCFIKVNTAGWVTHCLNSMTLQDRVDMPRRYYDGVSPDDLYAVRSLGIGQATGMEVFLDKNGKYTYLFDKNNEVVIGSSRPVSQGNVNMKVRYRKFTLAVYTRICDRRNEIQQRAVQ